MNLIVYNLSLTMMPDKKRSAPGTPCFFCSFYKKVNQHSFRCGQSQSGEPLLNHVMYIGMCPDLKFKQKFIKLL